MAITLRRALVSSPGPRSILSDALDHMRHTWEVDFSLEQNLARVIAIDKEDFASLNKLRLLRMCKVLCKSSAPLDMAVGIVSTTPIDDIMYGLFGFDRVRVSILDLMRPRTSITTMASRGCMISLRLGRQTKPICGVPLELWELLSRTLAFA